MKTNELTGAALDWAVHQLWCEGCCEDEPTPGYSTNGSLAVPIIESDGISILRCDDDYGVDKQGFCNNKRIPVWCATIGQHSRQWSYEGETYPGPQYEVSESDVRYGPTPLIAAMRCYVAIKLGNEVDVPKELT